MLGICITSFQEKKMHHHALRCGDVTVQPPDSDRDDAIRSASASNAPHHPTARALQVQGRRTGALDGQVAAAPGPSSITHLIGATRRDATRPTPGKSNHRPPDRDVPARAPRPRPGAGATSRSTSARGVARREPSFLPSPSAQRQRRPTGRGAGFPLLLTALALGVRARACVPGAVTGARAPGAVTC